MATIKLPDTLVNQAKIAALVNHRSIPKQLEHWMVLGKAAEDNPDLPLESIKDILEAKAEADANIGMTEFKFSTREATTK